MTRVSRHGKMGKNKHIYRERRTRNYKRDLDQIVFEDMLPENTDKLLHQPISEDLPGLGQHYCITCARYFITAKA